MIDTKKIKNAVVHVCNIHQRAMRSRASARRFARRMSEVIAYKIKFDKRRKDTRLDVLLSIAGRPELKSEVLKILS